MPITTEAALHWNRLEPRPVASDLSAGLGGEVRDALWFLTRQWQMGELQAEDTGSPAYVECQFKTTPMLSWSIEGGPEVALSDDASLEPQILPEAVEPNLAIRVELAQTFETLLLDHLSGPQAEQVLSAFRSAHPLLAPTGTPFDPIDRDSLRLFEVCAPTAFDGIQAYTRAQMHAANQSVSIPGSNGDQQIEDGAKDALEALLKWTDAVLGKIGSNDHPAWQPERLRYDLQITSMNTKPGSVKHAITPGPSGHIDWMSFDVKSVSTTEVGDPDVRMPETIIVEPMTIQFKGMPAPRFWDFEANDLSIADVTPDARDIVKMMFLDFLLVHGQDWYTIALPQPVGTIRQIDHLIVHDVFGQETAIRRAEQIDQEGPRGVVDFTLFTARHPDPVSTHASTHLNQFILPSSSQAAGASGQTIEEVFFARDEMANMAWAIETLTPNASGMPRPGNERHAAVIGPPEPPSAPGEGATAPLKYVIASLPPVHWVPLFTVPTTPGSVVFEKGAALRPVEGGGPAGEIVEAAGRILKPSTLAGAIYQLPEEEISRAGVRIRRTYFRTMRNLGGSQGWLSRQRLAGRGESSSGLRFDRAEPNR